MLQVLLRGSCLVVLALVFAPAAAAQTTLTLTGEQLVSGPGSTANMTCGTTTHITFHAEGVATGPYPGTFVEDGSITFQNGLVTAFHATFQIDSAGTTITGTKDFDPAGPASTGSCAPAAPFAEFGQVTVFSRYTANIDGLLDDSTESGTAVTTIQASNDATGQTTLQLLDESFTSGGPPGMTLDLSPAASVNPVGTSHTVTAVVRDAAMHPVQGVTVRFVVVGSSGQTTRCVTNHDGICTFTYQGPDRPGADEITACVDTDLDGESEPATEPCDVATKAWGPAGGTTTSGAHGGGHLGDAEVVFGFSAQSTGAEDPLRGACNVFDRVLEIRVKCLDIVTLTVTPGHATFTGNAELNGVATTYEITVTDGGNTGPDTFTIRAGDLDADPAPYFRSGPVTAGNVVINM